MMRTMRRTAILALLPVLAGCQASAAATTDEAAVVPATRIEGSAVRVTYRPAREVRLPLLAREEPSVEADTTALRGVRVVVGRVRMQRGDTLVISPTEILFEPGTPRQAWAADRSRLIVSASDPSVRIEVLSRWPKIVTVAVWVAFLTPLVLLGAALSATT